MYLNNPPVFNGLRKLQQLAWNQRKPLNTGGLFKYIHGGEYHAYNPDVVQTLQVAVKTSEDRKSVV